MDRTIIGLHPTLVRLAIVERGFLEHHAPAFRRLLEGARIVHQHVRPPHVGHAVMHAFHRMPGRVLQALVDCLPAGHQIDIDRLHALARNQAQRGVTRSRHQVEAALVHQRDHLVGGVGSLDIDLATGFLLEAGDPVVSRVSLAAFYVTRPGHDIDLSLALADLLQHFRGLPLACAEGERRRDQGCHDFMRVHRNYPHCDV